MTDPMAALRSLPRAISQGIVVLHPWLDSCAPELGGIRAWRTCIGQICNKARMTPFPAPC
jgi:hypothetical protein